MSQRQTPLTVLLRCTSWIIFGAIVVMTLGPLSARPTTPLSPNFDRFAANLVLGLCFALAYPRRIYPLTLALIGAAGGLELAQNFVPGRDGRVEDFLFKAAGVIVGVVAARLLLPVMDRQFSRRR